MKSRWIAVMLGLTLIAAATLAAPAASEPQAAAESLDFWADLSLVSTPARVPRTWRRTRASVAHSPCRARSACATTPSGNWGGSPSRRTPRLSGWGRRPVPQASASRSRPPAGSSLHGTGEIAFALSEGARCVGYGSAWEEQQEFTVTGGTGPFAGASGSGTLLRYWGDPVWGDGEFWTGTLTTPGTLTAPGTPTAPGTSTAPEIHQVPVLTGAVAKTVRPAKGAKSARVTFEVTATDDGGGDVPVSCWPRSGSRFPLGKTIVLCAATDASGNTATATFTVTVKRRR